MLEKSERIRQLEKELADIKSSYELLCEKYVEKDDESGIERWKEYMLKTFPLKEELRQLRSELSIINRRLSYGKS